MIVATIATRSVAAGVVIGAVFGAVRGTSILLVRRVRTAPDLRSLHRRLAANAARSERVGVAAQGALTLVGVLAIVGLR
jgi:ABC-type long-subunit fatty acid transport system fused permease/ATPase subunit